MWPRTDGDAEQRILYFIPHTEEERSRAIHTDATTSRRLDSPQSRFAFVWDDDGKLELVEAIGFADDYATLRCSELCNVASSTMMRSAVSFYRMYARDASRFSKWWRRDYSRILVWCVVFGVVLGLGCRLMMMMTMTDVTRSYYKYTRTKQLCPQNQISVFDYWITQKMRKITASTLILIVEPPIK